MYRVYLIFLEGQILVGVLVLRGNLVVGSLLVENLLEEILGALSTC